MSVKRDGPSQILIHAYKYVKHENVILLSSKFRASIIRYIFLTFVPVFLTFLVYAFRTLYARDNIRML